MPLSDRLSNDIPSTIDTHNDMGSMEDARLTTNDNKENK